MQQLSIDLQLLAEMAAVRLPPGCRQLALVGGHEKAAAMRALLAGLPAVLQQLPDLQHLLLQPAAHEALQDLESGQAEPLLVQGPGRRWRPTRLPGQPRAGQHGGQQQQGSLREQLRLAGVEVVELADGQPLAAQLERLGRGGR